MPSPVTLRFALRGAHRLLLLAHVGVPLEQVVSERDHFFALVPHRLRVAIVGHLDHGGRSRRRQESLLELDLLQEQLVGFEGRQLVLALHV